MEHMDHDEDGNTAEFELALQENADGILDAYLQQLRESGHDPDAALRALDNEVREAVALIPQAVTLLITAERQASKGPHRDRGAWRTVARTSRHHAVEALVDAWQADD